MQNFLQVVLHGLWGLSPNYLAQHLIFSFEFSDPTYLPFQRSPSLTYLLLEHTCICTRPCLYMGVLPTLQCPLGPSPLLYFVEFFSLILHAFHKILKDSIVFEVCSDDFGPQELPPPKPPQHFLFGRYGSFHRIPNIEGGCISEVYPVTSS